jgi:hypothetical protein
MDDIMQMTWHDNESNDGDGLVSPEEVKSVQYDLNVWFRGEDRLPSHDSVCQEVGVL